MMPINLKNKQLPNFNHFRKSTKLETKLEDMKNLSIDDIINLYREGSLDFQYLDFQYFQNPSIKSLSSNINIIDVGGFYDQSSDTTFPLILVTNTSGGYIEVDLFDNGLKTTIGTPAKACFPPISLPSNLVYATSLIAFTGKSSNNKIDVKAYNCTGTEDCSVSPPTCTTTNMTSSVIGKQIYPYDPTPPSAPIMTLSPSSGQIIVSWTQPPTTTPIFAYGIEWNGLGGYLPNTAHSYKITGLTSGQIYTVGMAAISQSGAFSDIVISSSGNIMIPSSLTIKLNETQLLKPTCTDYTGTAVTCPTLTWTSKDPSIATVDFNGNVTGVGLGETKITARIGSVISNISTITVNPPISGITVYPTSANIDINGAVQLNAVCTDNTGATTSCPAFTWASDNIAAATVDTNGMVAGTGYGTAHISAQTAILTQYPSTITVAPDYTGYLYIATNPLGARIYIDGVDQKEVTPMLIGGLLPITHACDLYVKNYLLKSINVLITARKITSIYEELTPLSSVCQAFNSVPKGSIFIDDIDMAAKTPNKICNISLGTHIFRLDGTFVPKANGTFDFTSVPNKAKIFVDGTDTGKITPGRVSGILSGTHTFSIRGVLNVTK